MKKQFECQCGAEQHRVVFYIDEYDGEQELSISYCLVNYKSFVKRCWTALKYIFRKPRGDGDFDSTLIKNEDLQTLIDMLVSVQGNYSLLDKKISLNIDCENNDEALVYLNAFNYLSALDRIKNEVRKIWKYEELTDEVQEKVDEIYENICNSHPY